MRTMIDEMGERVVLMIRTAMEAFAKRDLELCMQLPEMDDLGGPPEPLVAPRGAQACGGSPDALDWGMHMNLAARALERAGDNAVDIAEQIGYLVTGEFREFTDASHEVSS